MIEFPVGSPQDLASRRLQGAVAERPEWRLSYGSCNIPLTAQRHYGCDPRGACRYGLHRCDQASVVYWGAENGEWTWHVIAGLGGLEHPDRAAYASPAQAIAAAETGMAARETRAAP